MGKPNYSLEFRLSVVNFYLSGNGHKKTGQVFNISYDTVRQWVASYRLHGIDGITSKNASHTPEFRLSVIELMLKEGMTVREVTAHFNISDKSLVRRWLRVYNTSGADGLLKFRRGRRKSLKQRTDVPLKPDTLLSSPDDLTAEELRKELRYLRAENAYLKKLKALVQQKTGEKNR